VRGRVRRRGGRRRSGWRGLRGAEAGRGGARRWFELCARFRGVGRGLARRGVQKKTAESLAAKLQLVMKSGKYKFGYKQALKALRRGEAKLVVLAGNTPALRKSEIEYYSMLANAGFHPFSGDNNALGTACGKLFRVGVLTITDEGDSDLSKYIAKA
jgi:large subunit ribosomal protein L30e